MIDIKLIRSEPDVVKAAIRKRIPDGLDAVIDQILDLDATRRQMASKIETM